MGYYLGRDGGHYNNWGEYRAADTRYEQQERLIKAQQENNRLLEKYNSPSMVGSECTEEDILFYKFVGKMIIFFIILGSIIVIPFGPLFFALALLTIDLMKCKQIIDEYNIKIKK